MTSHANPKIAKAAQSTLFNLELTKTSSNAKKEKKSATQKGSKGHIMISYCWKQKDLVQEINRRLKIQRFTTWIDVEEMSGSTLDAMAAAVENAAVVCVCYSEAYKESLNCRQEAEYAFRQEKPIIPIRVEKNYQADGWLGILLGTKFYVDCPMEQNLDEALPILIKQLENLGKKGQENRKILQVQGSRVLVRVRRVRRVLRVPRLIVE